MFSIRELVSIILVLALCCAGEAQTYQGQGTAMGGLTGAVIGGIIGHQNDEVPEGALIGGAVGAVAGNMLGARRDQQAAMQRYYAHQNWQLQQQLEQQMAARPRGVSTADVVAMCRSGLSEPVIIGHIQANGIQRPLEVSDVIHLHQQGVPENIIRALQSTSATPSYGYAVPSATPPRVLVYDRYGGDRYSYPAPIHYHTYHHHHGCGYW